jgi:hypothetical protein
MTVRMNNNFINYSDFISVSLDALETAPRELFEKMMQMINSTLHQQVVELKKQALQIDEMNVIPVNDLEEYYDVTLDAIEDVKLLKKSILKIENKDILFSKLSTTIGALHEAYVQHMDRMGQLEVRLLSKEKSA